MPRRKGTPKTGGRKKGSCNKVGNGVRLKLKSIIEKEVENMPSLLNSLMPNERAGMIAKLMQFVIPKQSEVNIQSEIEALLNSIDTLNDEQLERLEEIINDCLEYGGLIS